ncbi:SHOCT domain-containing protein [Arcobacter ellisii]|uniref:Membrane protein n=1 Tax=Arcobacter ellisii TaxID=913109 RepID=A0A347UB25_9BACT|nr:SHOCT domain-containing protein [Arcobacter ellisii]AXX96053.1 putative membrane protein [Arcobacter ellisii]RXI28919.1 hypothetical protein CP962_12615 [Arcobacter ellisii]
MSFSNNVKQGAVIGGVLFSGGIFIRLFIYFFIFSFISFIVLLSLDSKATSIIYHFSLFNNRSIGYFFLFLIASLPALLLLSLKEWSIRRFRRKNNLPIYKNISLELLQMEANKNAQMEYEANQHIKNIYGFEETKDLNYWFELKEKGAITQEEYEAKKKEFLK